mgnify:CR=1 FL=1
MRRIAAFVAVLLVSCLCFAATAQANGSSVTLYLSYHPHLSNWGPTEASGRATVNVGEGVVDLTVTGLPRLESEVYQVWLVTPDLGYWVSLGTFQPTGDETTVRMVAVESIPMVDYRYFVVSVEPTQDDSPAPSGQNAIAGVFPNPDVVLATASAPASTGDGERQDQAAGTGQASGTGSTAGPAPEYLPETGVPSAGGQWWRWAFLALPALGLSALLVGAHFSVATPGRRD